METKTLGDIEVKTSPEGRFTARLCAWDAPDKAGDILRRGAFVASVERSLKKRRLIPVVFNHNWDDMDSHIGEVQPTDVRETATGLEVTGLFYVGEPRALKVVRQLQRGALSEWSMGFSIQKSRPLPSGGREITQAHLIELGPCLAGAGETETVSVKADAADVDTRRQQLAAVLLAPHRARLDLLTRRLRLDELRTLGR